MLQALLRSRSPIAIKVMRPWRAAICAAAVAAAAMITAAMPGGALAQGAGREEARQDKAGAAKSPRRELLRTETKKFGNWVLTCEEYSDRPGKPVCSAMLKIVDSRSGRLLFAWILAKQSKTGQIVGLLQTPTGVAIEPGVTFRFSKFERRFSYSSCEPGRCSTVVPLGLALRKEIGRVKKGHISIVSISGQRINFEILPDGFDKAYRAVLAVK